MHSAATHGMGVVVATGLALFSTLLLLRLACLFM